MVTHIKPNNWDHFKLGAIAEEVRSLYEPQKDIILPYIGLEHIQQNTLTLKGIGKSSETISTKKSFNAGQILFGSLRPYFRKVIRPKFSGVCSTDITVIRAKPQFDTGFLYYFIASQEFIDYATNVSSGTRMPRANWKVLSEKEWCFPKLNIQKKIASILSAYDDLIENNLRRIKILEEMAQNLYREWFVNFRFPGHENTCFVDSPLGQIPEGWEVSSLGEHLIMLESGKRPKGGIQDISEGIPSIGAENINGIGKHNYQSEKYVSLDFFDSMNKGKVRDRDVGLYKDGAYIGKSTYFRDGFPHDVCCINEHVFLLRVNGRTMTQNQLYLWLQEPFTVSAVRSTNANAAQPGINQKAVRGLRVIAAPGSVISEFDSLIEPYLALVISLSKRNLNLRQARDLLLPKLISGEVDVSDLDINVPEEVTF